MFHSEKSSSWRRWWGPSIGYFEWCHGSVKSPCRRMEKRVCHAVTTRVQLAVNFMNLKKESPNKRTSNGMSIKNPRISTPSRCGLFRSWNRMWFASRTGPDLTLNNFCSRSVWSVFVLPTHVAPEFGFLKCLKDLICNPQICLGYFECNRCYKNDGWSDDTDVSNKSSDL